MIGDAQALNDSNQKIAAFANSDVFDKLFSEGMQLVEETAFYLDGEGRQESKKLDRSLGLLYASESMRLTTRLMQAASWLLVGRAVREGELSAGDAQDDKYRIGAKLICNSGGNVDENLPPKLRELLERSVLLYSRIDRLDTAMFIKNNHEVPNPINLQMERLQAAFGIHSEI